MLRGIDYLRDPRLNRGLGFTLEERVLLGIHGLIPPRVKTQEEQLEVCLMSMETYKEDLQKYVYLVSLQDRNEKLFYRVISEDVEKMLPIVYTPTVGLACQKYGLLYRRPRGLFITIHDKGHVSGVIRNWPVSDVRAVAVTDGERILGLGDLGSSGMGIPVGKLALYTALGGIQPHQCLPVTLDVGTNNETLLSDPLYVGLRHKRVSGPKYLEFIDEFMQGIVRRYGQNTLIQFEDFGNSNAFRFLAEYRNQYCTFNDDIQGTASVAVSGLITSQRITEKRISDHKFLFLGAGEAAIGIANLCVRAMSAEGIDVKEAQDKIWMVDINGLLVKGRPQGAIEGDQTLYAKDHPPMKDLLEIVKKVRPSVMIGAAAAAGAFTAEVLSEMASFNERPIIFALSNPTSKAECTAEEAYVNTGGRCVFASGSPFPPVVHDGKELRPGQGNNAYIFPGVALGVICTGIHHIGDEVFLIAARAVAEFVSDGDLEKGSIYPPLARVKDCSLRIATDIAEYAYAKGLASTYPEPKDKRAFVMSHMYRYHYDGSVLPEVYEWPPLPTLGR